MDGFAPGDKENEVNPSTRNFFQKPIVSQIRALGDEIPFCMLALS
jgi:hypothetical protein